MFLVRMVGIAALLVCGQACAQGFADEDHDWGVAPPAELRQAPYTAPTPRELPGGRVVRTPTLKVMMETSPPPLLIDVAGGEGHVTLAGSHWLPGAGRGVNFVDTLQAELAQRLAAITRGDRSRPLVFFCVNSLCWLSYNAALRALALGYANVYWYRGGIEAWRAAGFPMEAARAPAGQ